ncbi:hypothetical protein GKZ28_14115 [Clostridium chromiireducens]|uniref:DUF4046 domain-containing protein n=1 Tax=Clostridium chromiireducens TaxID=225345 RepID=A0A964RNP0_9CLOT|nr:hypothetical protein [Clostridium chromiireducens]MVX64830.1 hypothetical protein [Clostridium chromiireducens]
MKSFNRNSSKYNLSELTVIEIYELVRSGELKKFPMYFWECDESNEYAPKLTRYLIENILNWTDNDIKKKLRKSTFRENSLGGLICIKYNDSAFVAITAAYPEKKFHAWDFVNTPNDYWQGEKGRENAIAAMKWLIEEKLKWSEKDIIKNLNQDVFKANNLIGMLNKAFNCRLFEAIDSTYPGKFKKWEIGDHVRNDYWTKEEGILAVKWLIEDKLKWSDDDIKKNYTRQIYKDNNLYGMIQRCFNSSPFEALNAAYPNKFKEWELPNVPRNFWNSEKNCITATKWLIEKKLKFDIKTAKEKLSKHHFKNNNLSGLYATYPINKLIEIVEYDYSGN